MGKGKLPDTRYYVVEIGGEVQPGIPTPLLIQQGGGEAYHVPSDADGEGIWYLHDAPRGYEAADGKYARVRVIRNPNRATYFGDVRG